MARVQRHCKWCGDAFFARSADVARGWAKFCSKSCKAKHQEKRTGQHADYLRRAAYIGVEVGWDGYKEFGP